MTAHMYKSSTIFRFHFASAASSTYPGQRAVLLLLRILNACTVTDAMRRCDVGRLSHLEGTGAANRVGLYIYIFQLKRSVTVILLQSE